eukprot:18210-Heterococcus_DN1.PRE.3
MTIDLITLVVKHSLRALSAGCLGRIDQQCHGKRTFRAYIKLAGCLTCPCFIIAAAFGRSTYNMLQFDDLQVDLLYIYVSQHLLVVPRVLVIEACIDIYKYQ